MAETTTDLSGLPSLAEEFAEEHPDVWSQYTDLGKACADVGPLDEDTKRLVKLTLAVGSQSEGAVHSHVRRGLDEQIDPAALRHVATLSIPTIGFPKAMVAMSWIENLTE